MDVYELTGLINASKIPEEEKRRRLLEILMIEQQRMKKIYSYFSR
jgi:hypothetical protein